MNVCTSDTTFHDFEGVTERRNKQEFKNDLNVWTYTKLYNKALEIEDIETKEKFIIICVFLIFLWLAYALRCRGY